MLKIMLMHMSFIRNVNDPAVSDEHNSLTGVSKVEHTIDTPNKPQALILIL